MTVIHDTGYTACRRVVAELTAGRVSKGAIELPLPEPDEGAGVFLRHLPPEVQWAVFVLAAYTDGKPFPYPEGFGITGDEAHMARLWRWQVALSNAFQAGQPLPTAESFGIELPASWDPEGDDQ